MLAAQLLGVLERAPSPLATLHLRKTRQHRRVLPSCSAMQQPDAPAQAAAWCRPLSGCSVDGIPRQAPTTGSSSTAAAAAVAAAGASAAELPPIVALGKHDALHRGHRALVAAAAEMGGAPWLVSFSGMAEVLGWPARLPLVAPCDRRRVLAAWAPHCQGRTPRECAIPFAEVRTMSPEAFLELLAAELQVAGVVVGANYRFGYRAAGTTEVLRALGPAHGLRIRVLDLVGGGGSGSGGGAQQDLQHAQHAQQQPAQQQQQQQPPPQQQQQQQQQAQQQAAAAAEAARRAADRQAAHAAVSSSRVRHALAHGDVADAALCLDRPYRLVASLAEDPATSALPDGAALRLPAAALLNQPPAPGRYAVRAALVGADTLQALGPERQAVLGVDEAGITLHGGAELLGAAAAAGARHLTLDFVGGERGSAPAPQPSAL